MNDDSPSAPASIHMRHRLSSLHKALLNLHKALLDVESANYERENGSVSRGELLHLVMSHEQFAWLRAFSMLIVRIDEVMDAKDPVATNEDAQSLLDQATRLVHPESSNGGPASKYSIARLEQPTVSAAHKEVDYVLSGN